MSTSCRPKSHCCRWRIALPGRTAPVAWRKIVENVIDDVFDLGE